MSPKQRFPVMLEPEQVAALREIEARTGARISEQIRRAIDDWLAKQGNEETGRRRAQTRRRP
jgi:ribbon-helix-helix protein